MDGIPPPTLPLDDERRQALLDALLALERRVGAVADRQMRRTLVLEAVHAMDDEALVASLVLLVHRVGGGQASARVLLQEIALEESLFHALPFERRAAAYDLAAAWGALGIARMFLSPLARDNPTADEAWKANDYLSLPLGLRRAAARTRDRMLIDRLLHDRSPYVISLLLDNPRLVERDVIKIAAMRPTRPEVLETVARHGRWTSNYRVRKALAANPYTPRTVALQLLPTLLVQDLRAVLERCADLDRHVEDEIRRLLTARAGQGRARDTTGPASEGLDAEVDALIAAALAERDPEFEDLDPQDLAVARPYADDTPEDPFAEDPGDLEAEIDALLAGLELPPARRRA